MSAERLLLSDKYKAFLRCDAPVEFLEGTTAAGKTTVGLFKFMLKVAESPKKLHIIAAKDTGTAEKNIINKDLGIMDDFGVLVEYNGNGTKDDKIPHILFHTSGGDKVIYVMGYGDKKKWQKALGGQYGCLYIDEINTADIDFVREAAMRCDYLMATLNPDDPSLPVYKEYINCSRPLPEWEEETPQEIKDELKEEPKHGWVHWFFSFAHNLGLPKEKLDKILANTPKGTKIWKNKIQGLRGKATGLVFPNFDRKKACCHSCLGKSRGKGGPDPLEEVFLRTGYSLFQQVTRYDLNDLSGNYRRQTADHAGRKGLQQCRIGKSHCSQRYGCKVCGIFGTLPEGVGICKDVYIDNADQATMTELKKYRRLNGCIYNFWDAYKKLEILDRIKLQLGWIQQDCYLVVDECPEHLAELEK